MSTTIETPTVKSKPKVKSFVSRLIIFVVFLAVIVWFAPTVASRTSLRNWIAQQIFSEVNGEIRIGEARVSWLSPVELIDVELRDTDGQTVMQIDRVTSKKPLWKLLENIEDVGLFRCESADLKVVFADSKCNLEQTLTNYLYPKSGKSSGQSLAFGVELTSSVIHIRDVDKDREWALDIPHALLSMPKNGAMQVKVDGRWKGNNSKLFVEGVWASENTGLVVEAEKTPLAVLEPMLRRIDPSWQLDGNAQAKIRLQSTKENSLELQGTADLQQLQAKLGKRTVFDNSELKLAIDGKGKTETDGKQVLESATVNVVFGQEKGEVRLLEPLTLGAETFSTKAKFTYDGDLSRWQEIFRHYAGSDDALLSGQTHAEANLILSTEKVECAKARVTVTDIVVNGSGLRIQEPKIVLTSKGQLNAKDRKLELLETVVDAGSIHVDIPRVTVSPNAKGELELNASAFLRGNLKQFRTWITDPNLPTPTPMDAKLAAIVGVKLSSEGLRAKIDVKGDQFTIGNPHNPYWQEPKIRLIADGIYLAKKDQLVVEDLRVEGSSLKCKTSGKIDNATTEQNLTLKGTLDYDLQKLTPNIRPYLGTGVNFVGTGTGPLELTGPLSAKTADAAKTHNMFRTLKGSTKLHWESADAYGLRCGMAMVPTKLENGWVLTPPIQTSINQGKLNVRPAMRVDVWPMELYLAQGKVIERAKITKEMSQSAIRYALPALATMVEGTGEISLELQGAKIPLDDLTKADLTGRFTIHEGNIKTSALVKELAALANTPATVSLGKETVVPFRLVGGKVYHKNFRLEYDNFTVVTRGSVGLDGKLNLLAEFPIPRNLVGGKIGQALTNQKITVPIGGTLENPKVDGRSLNVALQRALQNSGQDLLKKEVENQLKKGLQKLFR